MFKLIVTLCLVGVCYGGWSFGGWKDADKNGSTITELAGAAVEHRNAEIDAVYYRGLVEIKKARQQTVNGVKYEVTVILGETHCARGDAGAKLCEIPANSFKEECVFTFFKEPNQETKILSYSCANL